MSKESAGHKRQEKQCEGEGAAISPPRSGFVLFERLVDLADQLFGRCEGFVTLILPLGRAGLVAVFGEVEVGLQLSH